MRGNMKAERARLGMTAQDVTDATGVSKAALLKWEAGTAEPTTKNLIILARFYRCSIEYLLGITNKRTRTVIAETAT